MQARLRLEGLRVEDARRWELPIRRAARTLESTEGECAGGTTHMISRRKFLASLAASGGLVHVTRGAARAIDRAALVRRHDPLLRNLDPLSPLSVGNGEFAFTADVTGLQTFPEEYESQMPLCTMSQWGWHTTPRPAGLEGKELRFTPYDTHGREVLYHTSSEGQKELFDWLRENPHRLHLGRVGLLLKNR